MTGLSAEILTGREGFVPVTTPGWLIPALLAMVLWGVWGVFQKFATNTMAPQNVYFISAVGAFAVVLMFLSTGRFTFRAGNFEGAVYALIAGMCSSLGGMLFLRSLSRGEAAIVITFTALYPVVTIILSFILLSETITVKQGIGIVLAVLSMVLLI